MSRSYDDTATPALISAASALHNAHNALNIAAHHTPRHRLQAEVRDVQAHIMEALDAIAAEIGEEAMLTA